MSSASTTSQVYTWEPSNEAIAARYGLRAKDILRFDTNTSPAPPSVAEEILAGRFEPSLNEYPDSSYADLTSAASGYLSVATERIVVGAGADEILDIVAKAFLRPGTAASISTPTYPMYAVLTSQRGANIVRVPRLGPDAGYAIDVDRVLGSMSGVAVIWICSPNNPTGAPEPLPSLEAILDAAHAQAGGPLVVIDEAYAEFVDWSAVAWLDRYPNLLVVRTISKAFGLAGIRVGYAAGSRAVVARLETVRPPGSISTVSATLGAAVLRHSDVARENVVRISAERHWLAGTLARSGWTVAPSVTNFLLVKAGAGAAAEALADRMLRTGIVPRTFPADHPLAGHLRLTVRARWENERLIAAMGPTAG